jgi:hypothetical protein
MSGNRPVLVDYQQAEIQPETIGIRRDGDEVVVVIGPASPVRLMLHGLLPIVALVVLIIFLVFALFIVNSNGGAPNDLPILGIPIVACGALLLALLIRFVPVARFGRLPAVFRASRERLEVIAPILGKRGRRQWPSIEVADISIRHAGTFPVLLSYIRFQISCEEETTILLIPSPGRESLAVLEHTLREAMGLPIFNS